MDEQFKRARQRHNVCQQRTHGAATRLRCRRSAEARRAAARPCRSAAGQACNIAKQRRGSCMDNRTLSTLRTNSCPQQRAARRSNPQSARAAARRPALGARSGCSCRPGHQGAARRAPAALAARQKRLGGRPPPASPQRAARRRGQGAEQQRGGQRALGRRQAGRRAKRVRGVQRRGQQRQQPAPLAQLDFSSAPADRGRRAGVYTYSHGACFKKERARLGVRPSWGGCGRGPPAAPGGSRRPAAHAAWMARTRAAASSASALPATARSHLRAAARPRRRASARPGGAHGRREADPESILGCATDSCPLDTPQ